ncbi:hypothetical protein MR642_05265 [bacterium]|nr:hypothetical protein [bacterium]
MSILSLKHLIAIGALCTGTAMLTTGCVSDDYDLDSVDLTMGLGSDGLKLKMGNTEKILLGDILDLDESVKLDANNLYYLVEEGTTNFNIHVNEVSASFKESTIETSERVLDYNIAKEQLGDVVNQLPPNASLPVAAGIFFNGEAKGYADVDVTVDVPEEVSYISTADVKDMKVSLQMHTDLSPNVKFGIDKVENFSITIPSILQVREGSWPAGWTMKDNVLTHQGALTIPQDGVICSIVADKVDTKGYGAPKDGKLAFGKDANGRSVLQAGIQGKVYFKSTGAFNLSTSDYADIYLTLSLGNSSKIDIEQVTGKFSPEINPTVDPIDIASSLPDFLNDDAVKIGAANPTLKFTADLTSIPVGLNLSGELTSVKKGAQGFTKKVGLPVTQVEDKQHNTVYYYQSGKPYDPEYPTLPAGAVTAKANNLSSLIEKLPDEIRVDLTGGKLSVQDKEYTIQLGHDYQASADYKVYVPFQFDKGLTIVYNDSTDSMSEDLEDYQAEGLMLKATAQNTIPLDLVATITAYDVDGNVVPGINFSEIKVPAGDGTNVNEAQVEISATLDEPSLLQKMDRLKFSVKAANDVNGQVHELCSTQYLRFADVRLYLTGKVIGDFN